MSAENNSIRPDRPVAPETVLEQPDSDAIRAASAAIEGAGGLTPEILDLIYQRRWFQLLVPKASNGLEVPLPEVVRIFEALAWADGSTGWCVNLGAGANIFAGYFDAQVSKEIFESPKTCCAGSGAKSAQASKTDGGYKVTGKWRYASGANHATHITGNAVILDESGKATTDESGNEVFRSFIFPIDQVVNHKDWKSIGLRGSSSNSVEVRDSFVPSDRVFTLLKPSNHAQGPLFKFPFAAMAVVNMTSMITGIAMHFEDLYRELAATKKPMQGTQPLLLKNQVANDVLERASSQLSVARQKMYDSLESMWKTVEAGNAPTEAALEELTATSKGASRAARNLVNELYPLFGMSVLDPDTEASRVFRDAMTASQHYLLSPL